tara:strand:+ start:486 stop:1154 length:669 start_codon:yes stop_codon:yes gene_type:complete
MIELLGQNSSNVVSKVYVDTSNNLHVKDAQLATVIASSKLQVDVITSALPTGASTEATLSAMNAKITAMDSGAVVVASSALPAGGATSALQTTGNSSLATIEGAVSAGIMQVSSGTIATVATTLKSAVSVADSAVETTTGVDIGHSNVVSVFGNLTDYSGNINVEVSSDDSVYYDNGESIYVGSTGDFYKNYNNIGARYIRLKYTNNSGMSATWTAIASVKA